MFGKSRIGDSVAAEMDRILGDSEFQSVFVKPELSDEYTQALAQDTNYKAFVRIASKKKDKKDKDKKEKAAALEYIVDSLNKTSEALDNLGLQKSATVALALINGIYRETFRKIAQEGDNPFADRVDEMEMEDVVLDLEGDETVEDILVEEEEEKEEEEEDLPDWIDAAYSGEQYEAGSDDYDEDGGMDRMGPSGLYDDDYAIDGLNSQASRRHRAKTAADDKKEKDKDKAKKDCVAFAKKCFKKHKCKGTAEVTDKGIEVTCKGEKEKCNECCAEIKEYCKDKKVVCKIEKEHTDKKKDKKAFVITDRVVLATMKELDDWLK